MVYQEQVMQIAQVIGGYTLGGADLLRRAMGKKKPEEMASSGTIFVDGATKNGVSPAKADAAVRPDGEVRRLRLQQVARRGLCAGRLPDRVLQGASRGGVHGRQPVAGDGRHRQGAQLPRRRDRAGPDRAAAGRQRVEVPLRAGRRQADPLRPGRGQGHGPGGDRGHRGARAQDGPFRDLFDFCRRVDKRVVNRRAIEALVRAGAFDAIEPRRAALLASVGIALEAAEHAQANVAQVSLFGDEASATSVGLVADPRLDRRRAAAARKGRHRLLPVRASFRRLRRGARLRGSHDAREPATAAGTRAGRRHRHADARAVRPPRARRPSSRSTTATAPRRSWSTTRPSTSCAACCARTRW